MENFVFLVYSSGTTFRLLLAYFFFLSELCSLQTANYGTPSQSSDGTSCAHKSCHLYVYVKTTCS